MSMQIAAPGHDLRVQVSNTIEDWHRTSLS
ncbi:hypothetical protein MESS2_970002 [Mesorhizobium metallidurans STM 2683]|uniref:Uncharacterized protein n=1 Tax=Mesorhizobium metallidurans STM 2683 TaxID=1297569 RepID=M5FBK0_9HYPH|nr:hypothetical protein MESS2_970002 [Mesorhizobium metallidurans STM 2683]